VNGRDYDPSEENTCFAAVCLVRHAKALAVMGYTPLDEDLPLRGARNAAIRCTVAG
jgi:hypothetical protein